MNVGNVTSATAPQPLYVTALANQSTEWAATRQAAIAGNIANADTPRYKARDIAPFDARGDRTQLQLVATHSRHMLIPELQLRAEEVEPADAWDLKHSANTVSLDEELAKADETARTHQLSVSVLGTYHRMLLAAVSSQ